MKSSEIIISTDPLADDLEAGADIAAEAELRELSFGVAQHGLRLDRALAELVPEFSRSYLQQLVQQGAVSVNASVVRKPAAKVRGGDAGCIELRPTPQRQAFKAEHLALDVVYVDAHLLVINKPAGLVVHPAPGIGWTRTPAV